MSKLIVSLDGEVVTETVIHTGRTTIGRRPYNDLVMEHATVSGEHAALRVDHNGTVLTDLDSTNGTFVNGLRIREQVLASDDWIDIGKYRIQYLEGTATGAAGHHGGAASAEPATHHAAQARVRVLSGASAGRELALVKPVTTIGKHGVSVASITRKGHGFELAHVDGATTAEVNGVSIADGPIVLQNRDQIKIGTTRLEYTDQ